LSVARWFRDDCIVLRAMLSQQYQRERAGLNLEIDSLILSAGCRPPR
jgi:hypothetical protein